MSELYTRYAETFRRSAIGQWYYGRETSEQKIIFGLALLITVSLLWVAIWKPVSDWQTEQVARQLKAQQLYDWLQTNEAAAKRAAQAKPSQKAPSRTPAITRAAQAHQIAINRLMPESNGAVSVVLEQQSFNKIIAWVNQLEQGNDIQVDRATLDGLDAPGYVNAQFRLN